MFWKRLKLLPVICLLAAQIIVAGHIHDDNEAVPHEQCVYCQTAAELSGMDTPQVVSPVIPVRIETPQKILKAALVSDQTLSAGYHSRAPPAA